MAEDKSIFKNGLTETLEYGSVEEANKHVDKIREMVHSFGFGRIEEYVVNGVPTQVSVKLDFKLKKKKVP